MILAEAFETGLMPPRFTKFHGYGNDYLVFEADQLAGVDDLGQFAKRICNRHYGAGADGIAVVHASENDAADFTVRIFNPDGSEAGMSGNGTRCAASYLFLHGLWSDDRLRLQTRNGVKRYFLRERLSDGAFLFQSELGQPGFDSASIPMLTDEPLDRRGVGETESSGTCSCAAVVASVVNEKTDRSVKVHAPGGVIPIEWREDGEVVLTGRADVVYSGEWLG